MTKVTEALKSIAGFVVVILAALLGIGLAALSFFWFLIPKIRREEREKLAQDANACVEHMRAEIQKAHAEREVAVGQQVTEIEKKADEQRAQDSVALANELLKEG